MIIFRDKSCAGARVTVTFALTALASQIALALPVDFDDGKITGSFNSTLTTGIGIRLQSPDCGLVGDASSRGCSASSTSPGMWTAGDDGNLNYKKGQLFTAYLKGTHELLLTAPGTGVSLMARASYLLDGAADRTERTELSSESKRKVARDFRLLDFWASKDFETSDNRGRVRVGNQVINWGESLFLAGGINATNAMDNQRLLIPGTQLKEAVLPAPMISVASSVGAGFNVEAYYQFGWNKNRFAPIGTYWSAGDFFDDGARQPFALSANNFNAGGLDCAALIRRNPSQRGRISQATLADCNQQLLSGAYAADPTNPVIGVPIAPNLEPKNSGQFGVSLRYKPQGSQADFGFYALRYHDKSPVLNFVADSAVAAGGQYQFQFLENRTLYGVSTNFPLGNWAIGGELSYRPKDAISLGSCFTPGQPLDSNVNFNPVPGGNCPLWKDNKKYELHLTALLSLLKSEHAAILAPLGADTGFFSMEFVATRYPGVNPNGITRTINGVQVVQLPAAGFATWLENPLDPNSKPRGVGTANSYGIIGDFNWTYDGTVIPGWQLTPGLTYFRGLKGDTPSFAASYLKGVQSLNLYLLFNQNPAKWQSGVNYTTYFGGGDRNFFKDRAFVGGFVSYNF